MIREHPWIEHISDVVIEPGVICRRVEILLCDAFLAVRRSRVVKQARRPLRPLALFVQQIEVRNQAAPCISEPEVAKSEVDPNCWTVGGPV